MFLRESWSIPAEQQDLYYEEKKKDWIQALKHVLMQVGRRDNTDHKGLAKRNQNLDKAKMKGVIVMFIFLSN